MLEQCGTLKSVFIAIVNEFEFYKVNSYTFTLAGLIYVFFSVVQTIRLPSFRSNNNKAFDQGIAHALASSLESWMHAASQESMMQARIAWGVKRKQL